MLSVFQAESGVEKGRLKRGRGCCGGFPASLARGIAMDMLKGFYYYFIHFFGCFSPALFSPLMIINGFIFGKF